MNLNCIIVDDEPRAYAILVQYIARLSYASHTASCMNVMEACDVIRNHKVDLIFLDINMPELDGFSLLEMISPIPLVILTTAYTDYALKSYDYNAIDYLHKPIRFERFAKAMEKASKWKQLTDVSTGSPTHIAVKTDGYVRQLKLDDILFMESLGNYVRIVCESANFITLMKTKELEDKLPKRSFVRIHKSYIVNAAKIRLMSQESVQITTFCLPIGKTYKKYVTEYLRNDRKHI